MVHPGWYWTVRVMSLPSTKGLCRAPRFPFTRMDDEIGAYDVKEDRFLKGESPGRPHHECCLPDLIGLPELWIAA